MNNTTNRLHNTLPINSQQAVGFLFNQLGISQAHAPKANKALNTAFNLFNKTQPTQVTSRALVVYNPNQSRNGVPYIAPSGNSLFNLLSSPEARELFSMVADMATSFMAAYSAKQKLERQTRDTEKALMSFMFMATSLFALTNLMFGLYAALPFLMLALTIMAILLNKGPEGYIVTISNS